MLLIGDSGSSSTPSLQTAYRRRWCRWRRGTKTITKKHSQCPAGLYAVWRDGVDSPFSIGTISASPSLNLGTRCRISSEQASASRACSSGVDDEPESPIRSICCVSEVTAKGQRSLRQPLGSPPHFLSPSTRARIAPVTSDTQQMLLIGDSGSSSTPSLQTAYSPAGH
jgi:hypothetical protein